jgi:catechol 2,3-dioxygenase-like lactoylglutathione lyase family enzyme
VSRLFGPVRQIAFVVRDLDATLRYWTGTLGVGPFFLLRDVVPENHRYHGAPAPAPRGTIALGNSGDLQVELIQTHDDHPSVWRDFLAAGGEGFHHVSAWSTREEYDRTLARARAAGLAVAQEGSIPGSGIRFAYFATDTAPGGLIYELADILEPAVYPLVQLVADAARTWDGKDPVRELRL